MKKISLLRNALSLLAVSALTNLVFAGFEPPPVALPEPGTFELLAIGAVGAALFALKSRNKK